MQIHNVQQGSKEWHELRAKFFTASEAPAMMGDSKFQSRDDLLQQKATGEVKEVTHHQQKIFDRGHEAEAKARQIVEGIIGEELFPVTGSIEIDGLCLIASCDGLTMLEDQNWEHKLWNESLALDVENASLDPHYYWQLEQQLLVTGAEKALFTVSDGTEENMISMEYFPVPGRREQLIAGWKQFAKDLEEYQHTAKEAGTEAAVVKDLPAVSVSVSGSIEVADNFKVFEVALRDFIDNKLIRKPETDQDFADLEAQIKTLKKAEDALDAAENHMLSQVSTIDEMKRTKDMLHALARNCRLMAEKLVKSEKDERKRELIDQGKSTVTDYLAKANFDGRVSLPMPDVDFSGAIKGKKKLDAMKSAINDMVAKAKIDIDATAAKVKQNLAYLDENAQGFYCLFPDIGIIAINESDMFELIVKGRISDHQKSEDERLAREDEQKAEEQKEVIMEDQGVEHNEDQWQHSEPSHDEASRIDEATRNAQPVTNPMAFEIATYLRREHGLESGVSLRVANAIINGEVPHVSVDAITLAS